MNSPPEIPEPSEELAIDWANKIIASNKLTDLSSLEVIATSVANHVGEEFPAFFVSARLIHEGEFIFQVRNKSDGPGDPLDWFKTLGEDEEEQSQETKMLGKYALVTYEKLLEILEITNPKSYKDHLKKLKMRTFESPPDYKKSVIDFWAKKIIDYFELTDKTPLKVIIKKTILFFDILYTGYCISYTKFKDERKYPVIIDKIGDDTLMWLDVTTKIRRSIYCVHFRILTTLGRIDDYPKDPEYWFELVLVYEKLGLKKEANVFGNRGLDLNPTEMIGLTELVEFYSEQRRFLDGLKYLKKSGEIFLERKQFKVSLDIWKKIINFEPHIKENWINLEKTYLAMGDDLEAKKCRDKIDAL